MATIDIWLHATPKVELTHILPGPLTTGSWSLSIHGQGDDLDTVHFRATDLDTLRALFAPELTREAQPFDPVKHAREVLTNAARERLTSPGATPNKDTGGMTA